MPLLERQEIKPCADYGGAGGILQCSLSHKIRQIPSPVRLGKAPQVSRCRYQPAEPEQNPPQHEKLGKWSMTSRPFQQALGLIAQTFSAQPCTFLTQARRQAFCTRHGESLPSGCDTMRNAEKPKRLALAGLVPSRLPLVVNDVW